MGLNGNRKLPLASVGYFVALASTVLANLTECQKMATGEISRRGVSGRRWLQIPSPAGASERRRIEGTGCTRSGCT